MDWIFITCHYPPRNPEPSLSKQPRSSDSLSSHLSQFSWCPPGRKVLESMKFDNMAHSLFRDSRLKSNIFLLYSAIFLNHFFNAFLMRLICCSYWPPGTWFVTQTFFPHFFLLKLPYPVSHRAYFNTFIPIHCLHTSLNIDWKNIFHSQELNNGMLCELQILTAFHCDWHWTGVTDNCWFKVAYGGGEISCDCVKPFLSSFHYCNKKYDRGGKIF